MSTKAIRNALQYAHVEADEMAAALSELDALDAAALAVRSDKARLGAVEAEIARLTGRAEFANSFTTMGRVPFFVIQPLTEAA